MLKTTFANTQARLSSAWQRRSPMRKHEIRVHERQHRQGKRRIANECSLREFRGYPRKTC
jgi:hypothetical protein